MSAIQTMSSTSVDEKKLSVALSTRVRPPRPNALSASLTFSWRALLKLKNHGPSQLIEMTVFPIIMTLIFTYMLGGALGGSTGAYLQFFLPGILVQSVITITMNTGVALNTDISKGIFDRFRSMPIWAPSALVGALLGSAVRYLISSITIILLGLVMGFRPEGGVIGILLGVLILLLFSFSLSWIWTALGLILPTPGTVSGISSMIMFPLTFASNIFVDPVTMPAWLQVVINLNPLTHLVTAIRGFMNGNVTASQISWVLIACAVLIAVFGSLTMYLYHNKNSR